MTGRVLKPLWTLVAALAMAGALGNCAPDANSRGGAASGDDLGSGTTGSAASNDAVQRGRPLNDTLPGRDSRVQDGTDTGQGRRP